MPSIYDIEKEIKYLVEPRDDGKELKTVAAATLGLTRRQISSAKFRKDGLTLDGKRAYAADKVHAGQLLVIRMRESGTIYRPRPHTGDVDIVYEDEDLYVIDKCAPLPTQSSERQTGDTLEARLLPRLEGRAFRPVNRLDKGTSGLMLVAKHVLSQSRLQEQLHTPDFIREYLAVVEGYMDQDEGIVDAPIEKADGPTIRREGRPDGKEARTRFHILRRANGLSLVRLRLDTGRTHQIRVHMSYLGHPVFGDFMYGTQSERLPGRFALHSAYVSFAHPKDGRTMEFSSPLPPELARLMD